MADKGSRRAGTGVRSRTGTGGSTLAILGLHHAAVADGRCRVTGGGWGVLGTESATRKVCLGRPPAARVRVDVMPMISEGGVVGEALAASIVGGLAAGRRRYQHSKLLRVATGNDFEKLTLPDGIIVGTGGAATGERGRRAEPAARPSRWRPRRWCRARPWRAALWRCSPRARPPRGCATVGSAGRRHGLHLAALAGLTARLARGEGRRGAYPPGALFGPALAEHAGGQFILD